MPPPRPDDPAVLARLGAVLGFPWEVLAYHEWLQASARGPSPSGDYLFTEARRRFTPEETDVIVAADDLEVAEAHGAARLVSPHLGADLPLPEVSPAAAAAVLAAVRHRRSLAALREGDGVAPRVLAQVLEVAFGVLLFAPEAVADLDRELSGVEIVRYPGSPYEIDRAYWRNMSDVRRAFEAAEGTLNDAELCRREPERALEVLRRAHVLALMGASLASFYRPASPIAGRGAQPGALLTGAAELVETPTGTRFVAGPRVHAAFIGGEAYHRALYTVAGDPEAARPRELLDGGLDWGRLVIARAETDAQAQPWHCPPRPLTPGHLASLFGALAAAEGAAATGEQGVVVSELARFHQRFVRLHPFRCANQCLAMSLVNGVLRRTHGAGMPHLILDHLALRVSPAAYGKLFANAVEQYVVAGRSSAARFTALADKKRRSFAFIQRIAASGSLAGALAVVAEDIPAAKLALFAS